MSSLLPDQQPLTPAAVFLALWHEATQWTPSERHNTPTPPATFVDSVKQILSRDEAGIVFEELDQQIRRLDRSLGKREVRGRKFAIMVEIDSCFYRIHPRCVVIPPLAGAMPVLPQWLEEMSEQRVMSHGYYCEDDDSRLIARGPLTRYARDTTAANADTLDDRFTALTIVPRIVSERDRKIFVVQRVVDAGTLSGIDHARKAGSEKILFVPVAQQRGDLRQRRTGSRPSRW
jgi:hypothetical protein